jgi:hypothetical protein
MKHYSASLKVVASTRAIIGTLLRQPQTVQIGLQSGFCTTSSGIEMAATETRSENLKINPCTIVTTALHNLQDVGIIHTIRTMPQEAWHVPKDQLAPVSFTVLLANLAKQTL